MKKRYFAFLLIPLAAALLFFFRTDFRDTRGAALRKLAPFFDYSFNNDWSYEKEDIEKFTGIVDTKHSRYTVFYKDGNGKQREFAFDTTGGFAKEAVLWKIEEEMYQIFNESLSGEIEELGISVKVSSKLKELKGEGEKGKKKKMDEYKKVLLDEENGVKLYNVDEFFSRTASEYFQELDVEISPTENKGGGNILEHKKNIQKRIEERIGKKLHLNITISGENESRN